VILPDGNTSCPVCGSAWLEINRDGVKCLLCGLFRQHQGLLSSTKSTKINCVQEAVSGD